FFSIGTALAVAAIPIDVEPSDALFWPALIMTIGLLLGPLFRISRNLHTLLRVENLLVVGLVYWLVLDLLQGAYRMEGVSDKDVETAFAAIGVFAVALWTGACGRAWRPPRFVRNAVNADLADNQLFIITILCFTLGVFYYLWESS